MVLDFAARVTEPAIVRETEVARALGVSRTPVREASPACSRKGNHPTDAGSTRTAPGDRPLRATRQRGPAQHTGRRGTRPHLLRLGRSIPRGVAGSDADGILTAGTFRHEALQYGPRYGLPELQEWIAGYLERDGIDVNPEAVLIVHGAKQGIDLVCKLFVDPGDAVIVSRPTYQSALGIFRGWEVEFVEIGLDGDGLDVDALEARLRERERAGRPAPSCSTTCPSFTTRPA